MAAFAIVAFAEGPCELPQFGLFSQAPPLPTSAERGRDGFKRYSPAVGRSWQKKYRDVTALAME
jgi:hypothetical protein